MQETMGATTIAQMQSVPVMSITPPIGFSPNESFIPFSRAHSRITAVTAAKTRSGGPAFPVKISRIFSK